MSFWLGIASYCLAATMIDPNWASVFAMLFLAFTLTAMHKFAHLEGREQAEIDRENHR